MSFTVVVCGTEKITHDFNHASIITSPNYEKIDSIEIVIPR
jgi:hypothetical protein